MRRMADHLPEMLPQARLPKIVKRQKADVYETYPNQSAELSLLQGRNCP